MLAEVGNSGYVCDSSARQGEFMVFRWKHVVVAEEIDNQGHANNTVYLQWMQSAAIGHSSAVGWTPEFYQAHGVGWVARRHEIQYLRPVFLGDELVIHTWIESFRKVTSKRLYEMYANGNEQPVAKAETDWAFVSFPEGKPTRILPEIIAKFTEAGANS